jgi:plastocyanin
MYISRGLWLIFLLASVTPFALAAKSKPSVSIKDMQFTPADIAIKVGETVTWTNKDDRDHTVVADDGSFTSDNLKPGANYTHEFKIVGKFTYSCSYHPRMKGVVTVSDK